MTDVKMTGKCQDDTYLRTCHLHNWDCTVGIPPVEVKLADQQQLYFSAKFHRNFRENYPLRKVKKMGHWQTLA